MWWVLGEIGEIDCWCWENKSMGGGGVELCCGVWMYIFVGV